MTKRWIAIVSMVIIHIANAIDNIPQNTENYQIKPVRKK
jgi:hypothetical protein